jgi:hypothetical protein
LGLKGNNVDYQRVGILIAGRLDAICGKRPGVDLKLQARDGTGGGNGLVWWRREPKGVKKERIGTQMQEGRRNKGIDFNCWIGLSPEGKLR